jgi:hypothetical protein
VANSEDAHGVVMKLKHDAVIAKPQPKGTRQSAVKRPHIARASESVSQHAFEDDVPRHGTVKASNVGLGFVEPLDLDCVWGGHDAN